MLSLLKAGMALNYKISKKWMSRIYVLGNLKNFTSIWTSSYLYWISAAISGWNLTSRTQAIHKFRNSEICLLTLMVIIETSNFQWTFAGDHSHAAPTALSLPAFPS